MPKILVVGDAMLDRYIHGICTRLSPEAPVPIMQVESQSFAAGGACNTALNVQSLGVDCALVSIVGQDQAGKDLVSTLQSQLSHFHLQQCRAKTTLKTRHIANGHHLLRIDSESECPTGNISRATPPTLSISQKRPRFPSLLIQNQTIGKSIAGLT